MTNFEKIKQMSVEELAAFLCVRVWGCSKDCDGAELCQPHKGKANGLVEWLKMEVKQ